MREVPASFGFSGSGAACLPEHWDDSAKARSHHPHSIPFPSLLSLLLSRPLLCVPAAFRYDAAPGFQFGDAGARPADVGGLVGGDAGGARGSLLGGCLGRAAPRARAGAL